MRLFERAEVLARLLAERPALRADAERLAARSLEQVRPEAVTDEVVSALETLSLDDLAARVGRRPWGYVRENEAASDLLTEALRPFVDDIRRRAGLGMATAATSVALGALAGLFQCRDPEDGTVLAYAGGEETVREMAEWVATKALTLGVRLSPDALDGACPGWLSQG